MQKNVTKFLQSVVVLPVLTANLAIAPFAGMIAGSPSAAAIFSRENRPLESQVADNKQKDLAIKAGKIDAYFERHDLPLAGYGEALVRSAEENDLPWGVLAAVAMVESTGYKFACKKDPENGFGYHSCKKVDFQSIEEAIETVAHTLAGAREKTAHLYGDKDLDTRLAIYNGYANPYYVDNVHWVMAQIDNQEPRSLALNTK